MRPYMRTAGGLAILTSIAVASSSFAQSIWTDQSSDPGISVEFVKPSFGNGAETDFLTAITYLSGRFTIGQHTVAEVELPVSRYSENDVSETAVGNPYIGIDYRGKATRTRVGVRLPVASSNDASALLIGPIADYDRFEAFLPDVVSVYGSVSGLVRISDRAGVTLGGGPLVSIVTKDTPADNAELFAQYFVLAEFEQQKFVARAGFTGRAIVTEGDLSFAERSIHQFGIGAALNSGAVRPGIQFRVPLDDNLSEVLDFAVGLSATVILN